MSLGVWRKGHFFLKSHIDTIDTLTFSTVSEIGSLNKVKSPLRACPERLDFNLRVEGLTIQDSMIIYNKNQ
jgi:hypothetical protein